MNHTITTVNGDLGNLLHKNFNPNYCSDFIKVDGVVLSGGYRKFAKALKYFEVRDDDVWICTFPKSGTTWTQEMIWCIANDLDFEQAKVPLLKRFPYFKMCTFIDFDVVQREHPELEIPRSIFNNINGYDTSVNMHKITPMNEDSADLLYKNFDQKYGSRYVKVDGVLLPEGYTKFADAIENFEVRDDDVWICTFPKTGTTWSQEMIWCIANDLDYERAKVPIGERFVFLEVCSLRDFEAIKRDHPDIKLPAIETDSIDYIDKLASPRFIGTHLPFHLLPRQIRTGERAPRILSVIRNPKDTCISFYHHSMMLRGYHGKFEDFLEFTPYWTHVLGYWEIRFQDNVLILKFEDMKRDLRSEIKKVAKFLSKDLTDDQESILTDHLSFANMKTNPAVNRESLIALVREFSNRECKGPFIRRGTTEQWKEDMTPELIERFDDWTDQNLGQHTDLSFF